MKKILEKIVQGFLFPGTLVLDKIGVDIEEDGGIVRSFVNMCFWGTIGLLIALSIYYR